MDDILQEINQKNTQYQRAAIGRAKFLLAGNEDVRGQLKEILMGINEEINRENMDLGGIYRIDFLDDLDLPVLHPGTKFPVSCSGRQGGIYSCKPG